MPHCVVCQQNVPAWAPHPMAAQRSQFTSLMQTVGSDVAVYGCPSCGCNDRDRHVWLYLNRLGIVAQLPGAAVLHIAPEAMLERQFLALGLGDYVRADLHPTRPEYERINIEKMPFANERFELIVCNHVLEHVNDPARALAEFHRCLKPGGLLLAQTPYAPMLKNTFEVHGTPEPGFARLFFGQDDHVRLFGGDITDLFLAAGFQGKLHPHAELLPDVDPAEAGVNGLEPLFLFHKPEAAAPGATRAEPAHAARDALQAQVDAHKRQYGEWTYDIPLPHGVWTRGNLKVPHTRLRKLLQSAADLCHKPLAACRVLDLGCLDGLFAIEFALQGAEVVGVEVREASVKKAQFCQKALGLDRLQFVQDDVRNVSEARYGRFDIIICSGLLYHLPADDAIDLIEHMHAMCDRAVLIDTHIALAPELRHMNRGRELLGRQFVEHAETDDQATRVQRAWASADNSTSFWFTRASLVNLMVDAGFSTVYECFTPVHVNFGRPGLECVDRCTFVGLVAPTVPMIASPATNGFAERVPEGTLTYAPQ